MHTKKFVVLLAVLLMALSVFSQEVMMIEPPPGTDLYFQGYFDPVVTIWTDSLADLTLQVSDQSFTPFIEEVDGLFKHRFEISTVIMGDTLWPHLTGEAMDSTWWITQEPRYFHPIWPKMKDIGYIDWASFNLVTGRNCGIGKIYWMMQTNFIIAEASMVPVSENYLWGGITGGDDIGCEDTPGYVNSEIHQFSIINPMYADSSDTLAYYELIPMDLPAGESGKVISFISLSPPDSLCYNNTMYPTVETSAMVVDTFYVTHVAEDSLICGYYPADGDTVEVIDGKVEIGFTVQPFECDSVIININAGPNNTPEGVGGVPQQIRITKLGNETTFPTNFYPEGDDCWVEFTTKAYLNGVCGSVEKKINFYAASSTTDVSDQVSNASDFALLQNYPNPFNPATNIAFTLPAEADVEIRVFNTMGQLVFEQTHRYSAGTHRVLWDASSQVSGVYLCKLNVGGQAFSNRMLLLK